jgi:hypothetical protein
MVRLTKRKEQVGIERYKNDINLVMLRLSLYSHINDLVLHLSDVEAKRRGMTKLTIVLITSTTNLRPTTKSVLRVP